MRLEEIRSIAKSHHVSPGKLSKTQLIKSIQSNEGNFDCFATAHDGVCDQIGCSWREDCFEASSRADPS